MEDSLTVEDFREKCLDIIFVLSLDHVWCADRSDAKKVVPSSQGHLVALGRPDRKGGATMSSSLSSSSSLFAFFAVAVLLSASIAAANLSGKSREKFLSNFN